MRAILSKGPDPERRGGSRLPAVGPMHQAGLPDPTVLTSGPQVVGSGSRLGLQTADLCADYRWWPCCSRWPCREAELQAPPQQTGADQVPPPQQTPSQPPATDQPPAEQPARPTFRAGIDFVRVDVIVTNKKGEPVVDLKPEEVEVFEDGDRQDVESFKLFSVDEIAETTPARPIRSLFDEESEAQRPDVRLFAFFLDDYHVRRGNAMRSRIDLADFVRRAIAPQDMVGIMYPLTPTADVVMGRNHEALARALEQFDGRKYDYVPRNQFEEQYANYPADDRRADPQPGVARRHQGR